MTPELLAELLGDEYPVPMARLRILCDAFAAEFAKWLDRHQANCPALQTFLRANPDLDSEAWSRTPLN